MFKSIGHFFTAVGKAVVHSARAVAQNVPKIEQAAAAAKPAIEALTGAIYPPAVAAEELAFRLFGQGMQVVHDAGDAAHDKGANILLDLQTWTELKALLPQMENFAKQLQLQKPLTLPAPAAQ